ncbi:hypothetical protein G6F24_017291 [Rhizopus arrhizus]|nr:hypothetical protein G6F24_017291 [Rhizopus arrhizus]
MLEQFVGAALLDQHLAQQVAPGEDGERHQDPAQADAQREQGQQGFCTIHARHSSIRSGHASMGRLLENVSRCAADGSTDTGGPVNPQVSVRFRQSPCAGRNPRPARSAR